MADIDGELLASTGVARPRVAILPTASFPDGEDVFQRWASMGVAHFAALGAEVEPVLVRDRAAARRSRRRPRPSARPTSSTCPAASRATCCAALDGTAVGRALAAAHDRGAVLAGCSAGAMALAGHAFDFRVRLAALAAALGAGSGVRAGRVGRAALRRLAGAALGAHRAPGAARLGGPGHRRGDGGRRPRRIAGRSTARRASRSGAAAVASGSAPGTCSGPSPRGGQAGDVHGVLASLQKRHESAYVGQIRCL